MDKTNIYLQFSDFTTGDCTNLYLGTIFGLLDLDLPMPTTLQISNWQKSKIRRMFDSSNSYLIIVAHNPNTLKVKAITGAYNLHDVDLEDDSEEFQDAPQPDQPDQPTAVNQPTLEVVVTDQQCTMTFNGEQVHICEEVILPNSNPNPQVLKLLQSVKLKTVFIPLASTMSASSSPSPSTHHWMMASKQSNITSTSTPTSTPEPMTPPRSTTSIGIKTSNANPTVPTPAPVLTDAVQRCVDTAAETIATHREARLIFIQGLVRRILREAYRESTNPPSVGIPLAQSILDGIPSTSRGLYPSFVTHPIYHNAQIHYPLNPISQPPSTSATTAARVTSNQTKSTMNNYNCNKNRNIQFQYNSNNGRRDTQNTYCVCSNDFGGIPHQNKPSSCS